MRNVIGIQGKYGWAQHDEINVMLGLPTKAKLPIEGMTERVIQSIRVYVRAQIGEPEVYYSYGRKRYRRRFALRVRAICPVCNKDVALSRLPQHSVIHSK